MYACKPWWLSPALASITVDGVDKCNDRVRASNRPDPATERSISYCFQHFQVSSLLSSLGAILTFPSRLYHSGPLFILSLLPCPLLSG